MGVTNIYQTQFYNYIRTISEKELRNILINEKSNLKRFEEALAKLNKEITSRENNITIFKKIYFGFNE